MVYRFLLIVVFLSSCASAQLAIEGFDIISTIFGDIASILGLSPATAVNGYATVSVLAGQSSGGNIPSGADNSGAAGPYPEWTLQSSDNNVIANFDYAKNSYLAGGTGPYYTSGELVYVDAGTSVWEQGQVIKNELPAILNITASDFIGPVNAICVTAVVLQLSPQEPQDSIPGGTITILGDILRMCGNLGWYYSGQSIPISDCSEAINLNCAWMSYYDTQISTASSQVIITSLSDYYAKGSTGSSDICNYLQITPATNTVSSYPTISKRASTNSTNVAYFHNNLKASELCSSKSSLGPSFLSVGEKLFCHMETKVLYGKCNSTLITNCYTNNKTYVTTHSSSKNITSSNAYRLYEFNITDTTSSYTVNKTSTSTSTSGCSCTSGYSGLKNGGGPTGACCTSSNDCTDTCNSDNICGVSGVLATCSTTGGCSCTNGYSGLKNGGGPTGACCTSSNDCTDTCNSDNICGVSGVLATCATKRKRSTSCPVTSSNTVSVSITPSSCGGSGSCSSDDDCPGNSCCDSNKQCNADTNTCPSNGGSCSSSGSSSGSGTCTSGFCGLGSGGGPTGACCSSNVDCEDTCNSNGVCGSDNGTGEPTISCSGTTMNPYQSVCDGYYGTPDEGDCQSAIDKIPNSGTLSLPGISTKLFTSGDCEVAIQNESDSTTEIDYASLSAYLSQIVSECVSNNNIGGFTVDGADLIYAVQYPIPSTA